VIVEEDVWFWLGLEVASCVVGKQAETTCIFFHGDRRYAGATNEKP
jgi:hypothetical protein